MSIFLLAVARQPAFVHSLQIAPCQIYYPRCSHQLRRAESTDAEHFEILFREEFSRHGLEDTVTLTHRNVCKEGFTVADTVDAGK